MSGQPPLYRFVADRSGQSSPLAVLFVVGFAITSAGFVVSQGGDAFGETKGTATVSLNEQSMSKFDAEASVVALGSSDTRTVPLGDTGDGRYEVRDSGSWIRVEHRNYTASVTNTKNETVYNESMGAVVYESSGESIAYEGGGVWRTDEPGNTVMVSPPEFRYRSGTLTMPAIEVTGDTKGAAAGTPSATVERAETRDRIYPNETSATGNGVGAPYDDTGAEYDNPVQNGTVAITVHSPHYAGWADYFRERTDGTVSVDDANNEVTVVLRTAGGELGIFTPPNAGDSIAVPSVSQNGHVVDKFKFWLETDNANSNTPFNNRVWGMEYTDAEQRFAFVINSDSGGQCNGGSYSGDFRLTIYYDNRTSGTYQAFEGVYDGSTASDPTVDVLCNGGGYSSDPVLRVDLTSSQPITYQEPVDPGGSSDRPFQSADNSADLRDPVATNDHAADTVGGDDTLNAGETRSVDWVTNHYVAYLAPRFTLTTEPEPGSNNANNNQNVGVEEPASQGELRYDTGLGNGFIRYLHVTENEIEVRIAA